MLKKINLKKINLKKDKMRKTPKPKKILVELNADLWRELQHYRIEEECSFRKIVSQALAEYAEKYIKKEE